MNNRIVFAGEVMGELRGDVAGYAVGFAGDTFNAAVYCKRALGDAGKVSYLTRLGHDPLSEGAVTLARSEQIDTHLMRRDTSRNIGLYAVKTDEHGERSFFYWRDQSAARALFSDPKELDALEQADILCLSGITLAILQPNQRSALLGRIAELRTAGYLRLCFDSNYRPALWEDIATARSVITEAWSQTDIALPSVDDEMELFGDPDATAVMARLRDLGLRHGALKRSDKGPAPLDPSITITAGFPRAEHVVDTTAAGDSFNGGYLAALMQGQSVEDCMLAGHMTARKVVGQPGAIIPKDEG